MPDASGNGLLDAGNWLANSRVCLQAFGQGGLAWCSSSWANVSRSRNRTSGRFSEAQKLRRLGEIRRRAPHLAVREFVLTDRRSGVVVVEITERACPFASRMMNGSLVLLDHPRRRRNGRKAMRPHRASPRPARTPPTPSAEGAKRTSVGGRQKIIVKSNAVARLDLCRQRPGHVLEG